MTSPNVIRRMLKKGDATIVSVSQGETSEAEARPRQLQLAQTIHSYYGKDHAPILLETVDKIGERGIGIFPKLSDESARRLGRMYDQRSVLNGRREIDVATGALLSSGEVETVDTAPPMGAEDFWTYFPRVGLYYQVRLHRRNGRPVRGYVARRPGSRRGWHGGA